MRRHTTTRGDFLGAFTNETPSDTGITLRVQLGGLRRLGFGRLNVTLTRDQAAVLHARLDRMLSAGWAVTEEDRDGRQHGER